MGTFSRKHLGLALAGVVVMATTAVGVGVAPGQAAAQPTCGGLLVTIVGDAGPNVIRGTSGDDVIQGRGGNDLIEGRGGHDVICGNGGNDSLEGDGGNDRLIAGNGQDTADGGPGRDQCFAEITENC